MDSAELNKKAAEESKKGDFGHSVARVLDSDIHMDIMIGNITGVICDGAKPSCAMKVSSAVSTAIISSMMAIDNKVVSSFVR